MIVQKSFARSLLLKTFRRIPGFRLTDHIPTHSTDLLAPRLDGIVKSPVPLTLDVSVDTRHSPVEAQAKTVRTLLDSEEPGRRPQSWAMSEKTR